MVTQQIYGTSKYPATLLILQNQIIVANIETHKTMISIKEKNKLCKPKNKIDHSKFSPSCTPKITKPILMSLLTFFSTSKYKETPINKNSTVQTGANSQFGGVNAGFCKPEYHEPIDGKVKIEPTKPTASQITTEITSFRIFFTTHRLAYNSDIAYT